MALNFLIGHRGVGKTSLLRRIAQYLPDATCLDLDQEIETLSGESIASLFARRGEVAFRELERKSLELLIARLAPGARAFIALGAGFEGELPPLSERWWIRRKGDALGRIFLDRPRLDSDLSALEEFKSRFEVRESRYASTATRELFLREGTYVVDAAEFALFRDELRELGGALTLQPQDLKNLSGLRAKKNWGLDFFELRDDLLNSADLIALAQELPPEKILYSFRRYTAPSLPIPLAATIDWDLRLGAVPAELLKNPLVLSVHGDDFDGALASIESASRDYPHALLKLAPQVAKFEQLQRGDRWRREDPGRRSFLPNSNEGRWSWYRLNLKGRTPLNFWREGTGSSPDQPTLLEWLTSPHADQGFAAVLGSPVILSHSPVEQGPIFASRGVPFYAIDVGLDEWDEAFPFLEFLGLRWAAVTAPLKERAFASVDDRESAAQDLGSLNTLERFAPGHWRGTNTDVNGLSDALKRLPIDSQGATAVWGGGGVLSTLRKVLPHAHLYSVRSGKARDGSEEFVKPQLLVWAGPPSAPWPPVEWKPRWVLDLNYREDSRARDYAIACDAQYFSGQDMFRAQAEGQRDFWRLEL